MAPSAFQVRCGKPCVMSRATPRTTSSMPRVTRNEGMRRRVVKRPLTRPMSTAMPRAMRKPTSSGGDALVEDEPHDHGREAEDGADREVELAGGHEQRHGQRDHAQLRGERQQIADVEHGSERGVEQRERDDGADEQGEGTRLRLVDDLAEAPADRSGGRWRLGCHDGVAHRSRARAWPMSILTPACLLSRERPARACRPLRTE